MSTIKIKRSQAVEILRSIRKELFDVQTCAPQHAPRLNREFVTNIRKLLEANGIEAIEPCPGEAHMTGPGTANGMQDGCSVCLGSDAGWGETANKISIT